VYHPTTRVLTVLELLQSHARLSGAELAQRLEVDPRTIRRYIGTLKDLGVPVDSEPGRYGGYGLLPGYKLPPMMFTEEEALAVVLGLLVSRRLGFGDAAPAVEGALSKLDRVLPDRLRARVQSVQGALAFTPVRGAGQLPNAAMLLTLTSAADANRRVWMRYQSATDETERAVDPYGVVHHRGRWYVVGWCHLRDDVRMFRLDRVLALEPRETETNLSNPRPVDFDCVDFVLRSLATVPWGWPVEVLLEIPLEDARRRIAPDLGTLELDEASGGVILRTMADPLDWMARELVQIGCRFRILHPPELRDAMRALAREISRQARRAPRRPAPPTRSSGPRAVRRTAGASRLEPAPVAVQTRSPASVA
jgi:predicted DNA-binding transcriptional regulator YafY